ncbi:MAG: AsnC family transcriptional regulator [Nitrospirota bacterium]|nr:AsnC family transcriptional regulator [Nitrospirota bacterium]
MAELDSLDKNLLNILQTEFPLEETPFQAIARKLDTSEEEILTRIRRLKAEKIIRQISAIFDTKSLGYESSLVAAKVSPDRVDEAAEVINGHPGVSHNYLRNGDFNLWFTIAIPPNSKLGLEKSVELLGQMAGVESIRILPTVKLFKIGVKFDMTGDEAATAQTGSTGYKSGESFMAPVTEEEIRLVRELQKDIPIESRPFDALAANAGVAPSLLVEKAREFVGNGRMRRFAAVLHHRKAGFGANAMGVWAVPQERIEEVGQLMSTFAAVSHCYLRPSYADWPYNIFTMVHGRSPEDCEATLAAIAEKAGITNRSSLYSSKEYKKVRVRYFTAELEEWENQHALV